MTAPTMTTPSSPSSRPSTTNAASVVLRPGRVSDVDALYDLAAQTGPGFTSLVTDRDLLAQRLSAAETSFSTISHSLPVADHLLIAEKISSGEVVGCSTIKVPNGPRPGFLNYRLCRDDDGVVTHLQATDALADAAEVGSLFAAPAARGTGAGRLLAQGRYMLIASAPDHFSPMVMAELRGLGNEHEEPALWKCLGRSLYGMPFEVADEKIGSGDFTFMVKDTPMGPIPLSTLSPDAIAALGECHPDGQPALKLLKREGFKDVDLVDLFDGGILVSARTSELLTLKKSQLLPISTKKTDLAGPRALISNDQLSDFRCVIASANISDQTLHVAPETLDALGLSDGELARTIPA
ncbi:MAG: arginine N-succinyltransferase [Pseudomonadota bacterium]